jgi:hypothetical protein
MRGTAHDRLHTALAARPYSNSVLLHRFTASKVSEAVAQDFEPAAPAAPRSRKETGVMPRGFWVLRWDQQSRTLHFILSLAIERRNTLGMSSVTSLALLTRPGFLTMILDIPFGFAMAKTRCGRLGKLAAPPQCT